MGLLPWRAIALATIATLVLVCGSTLMPSPAWAGLHDDNFDGNIFALYAGNGSLIPPKVNLKESLKQTKRPTLLTLYIEDSEDCKIFSATISQLQAFYGRHTNIVPVSVDAIVPKSEYEPNEPGYYYRGVVPQTVLFDTAGNVAFDESGVVEFEKIDDRFREVFDLLPRSESVELKRRPINEVNAEIQR
ncbi:thylakoid membrane photosystem I accumulation factor [Oscillatoriales cyanobacterium LEGE 11467]|uniref:Thylakoid membrane photosystem I accumulation factor n=2 Tax=Zarconia TaxID=2992130 RepID=A0A928VZY1_9CYAN|nr:thylakoid membrane photosystem I accumulation factor [Zarconia navalis LEGE 11467]